MECLKSEIGVHLIPPTTSHFCVTLEDLVSTPHDLHTVPECITYRVS